MIYARCDIQYGEGVGTRATVPAPFCFLLEKLQGKEAANPPPDPTGGSMAREFAKSFYLSKEWKKVRKAALIRDGYLCTKCGAPAEEVHHIIHITADNVGDPSVTLNLDNVVSLCKSCHFAEHTHDKANGIRRANGLAEVSYVFDDNGYLVEDIPPSAKK